MSLPVATITGVVAVRGPRIRVKFSKPFESVPNVYFSHDSPYTISVDNVSTTGFIFRIDRHPNSRSAVVIRWTAKEGPFIA